MFVVRIWDVRPYCPSPDRLIKTLMGHQHSFEKVCELVQVEVVDCRVASSSSYECAHSLLVAHIQCACRTCCAARGRTTDALSLAALAIGTDTCTLYTVHCTVYSILLLFRSVASHSVILKYNIVFYELWTSLPLPTLTPILTCWPCRCVYVWDALSRRLLYKLPGHAGSVNETALHPREPIGTPRRTPSGSFLMPPIITRALQFMPIVFRHKF